MFTKNKNVLRLKFKDLLQDLRLQASTRSDDLNDADVQPHNIYRSSKFNFQPRSPFRRSRLGNQMDALVPRSLPR